jgi:hypothetical protein
LNNFCFGEKRPEPQKKERKRNRPSPNKKKKGKLGSVFDRDWIYRRVIAVCSSTTLCLSFLFFSGQHKNTSAVLFFCVGSRKGN